MPRDWQHKNVNVNIPLQLSYLCMSFRSVPSDLIFFLSRVSQVRQLGEDLLGQQCRDPCPPLLPIYSPLVHHTQDTAQLTWTVMFQRCRPKNHDWISSMCSVCGTVSFPCCPSPSQRSNKVLGDLLGGSNPDKYFTDPSSQFFSQS